MNLKKSTFIICLLISGLSSPAGLAQLQLQPRHKRGCCGLIMSLFAIYVLKNSLTTNQTSPPIPVCHTITAKVISSPIDISIGRSVHDRTFADIPDNERKPFTAGVLTALLNTPAHPDHSPHIHNVEFHRAPCTEQSISDLTLIRLLDFKFTYSN